MSPLRKILVFTGYVSIVGAVSMLAGAALWGASGTDRISRLTSHHLSRKSGFGASLTGK